MDVPWTPWQSCGRGHPLAVHGALRMNRGRRTWYCKQCSRERAALRVLGHDREVVARLVAGNRVPRSTPSERYDAAKGLMERGVSIVKSAEILGLTPRGVSHIRRKLRQGIPYGATKGQEHEPSGGQFRTPDYG